MRLFALGDSLVQGFMSGAAARTDLAFPSLLARALGVKDADFRVPAWPAGGLPFNFEDIFRKLHRRYGNNIRGLEWLSVLPTINSVLDASEEYYERGPGSRPDPEGPSSFHNVAVRGFDVADSWLVTSELCNEQVAAARYSGDAFLGVASSAFYRTARRVLNPSGKKQFQRRTALDCLDHECKTNGVDVLLLWLGSNNALGTVLDLEVRQTPRDENPVLLNHVQRSAMRWNLWRPEHFAAEYQELFARLRKILEKNKAPDWHVFVANVPLVTIAPLAKGVGPTESIPGKGVYYKYYTYVPFEESFAHAGGRHLTMREALLIDDSIRGYNQAIAKAIADENQALQKERYHPVLTCEALTAMAWKRNAGHPTYRWPAELELLHPGVDTKYYHADEDGHLKQGGIFSLDGVHPSAIGQGLVAHEFLQVMKQAGVAKPEAALDWPAILRSDSLYQDPIPLMCELYEHANLAEFVVKALGVLRDTSTTPEALVYRAA